MVGIHMEHEEGPLWAFPECGTKFLACDHKEERVWRHRDTMTSQTRTQHRPMFCRLLPGATNGVRTVSETPGLLKEVGETGRVSLDGMTVLLYLLIRGHVR